MMKTKIIHDFMGNEEVSESTIYQPIHDKILTKSKNITICLDYPLDHTFYFKYYNKKGFTFGKIIKLIKKCYKKIYYNDVSQAKYGVWGHDIGDLCIERFTVRKSKMGTIIMTDIGS
jgi:hypothetical protein